MDDDQPTPIPALLRRKSIAGPFMRSSQHTPPERPKVTAPPASPASQAPPPLTRANTVSGSGWFSGFFGRAAPIPTASSSSKTAPIPDNDDMDSYVGLSHSYDEAVFQPKHDYRSSLYNSLGSPRAATNEDQGAVPNIASSPPVSNRRLSESMSFTRSGHASTGTSPTTTEKPSLVAEADVRQGPIETDLFWLVLRDIGE